MLVKTLYPYDFNPYPFQMVVWKKYFLENTKRFIEIQHRRAGKDINWLTLAIAGSQSRIGTYLHTLPTLTNARKVIWNGMDEEGKPYLDYFPPHLIDGTPNNTEMRINFKNGSVFQLMGADKYGNFRGLNPVHVTFSEYSQQNPRTWDIVRPILTKNNGSAAFISTPFGQNHFYQLYKKNINNPKWFSRILTVKDTFDHDGKPLISPQEIEEDRNSGMSDNMIDQEYNCSFLAAVPGAYFARQLKVAYDQKRILDFPIDTSLPVSTYWDLGLDATSIWFVQFCGNQIRLISFYENSNIEISHFVNHVKDFRDKNGIVYGEHWAPHDGANEDVKLKKSVQQLAFELGLRFKIVPKIDHKQNAIEQARFVFSRCYFHAANCEYGITCLQQYHAEYNERSQTYSAPVHDWACLPKGTLIDTPNGPKAVDKFSAGDRVSIGGLTPKVVRAQSVGKQDIILLQLPNRVIVRCSLRHKIFTSDGLVEACNVTPGMVLFTNEEAVKWSADSRGIRRAFIESFEELDTDSGKIEGCTSVRLEESSRCSIGFCGRAEMRRSLQRTQLYLLTEIGMIFRRITGFAGCMLRMAESLRPYMMDNGSTGLCFAAYPKHGTTHQSLQAQRSICTGTYGSIITAIYPKVSSFIISIIIKLTMLSKILSYLPHQTMLSITEKRICGGEAKQIRNNSEKQVILPRVLSVKRQPAETVYDIEVEHHHAYVLSESGVVTSNSHAADAFMQLAQWFHLNTKDKSLGVHNNSVNQQNLFR
ncbi:hypothetical protein LCGC14_0432730 [marine sediment metagenome]|uniref:Hint domain-containing protein n=1 Tax=marine sediment metagenome TaxID=412755 RepID=A0A0F9VWZ2_9ZZZZ